MSARRLLSACALALAVSSGTLAGCSGAYAVPARGATVSAVPVVPVVSAEECKPDDQACKDAQEEQKIEDQQKKTQAAAEDTQKQIDAVGKKLKECEPGSSECMEKLSGSGAAEKQGISDMKDTISGFKTEPGDNASSTSSGICSGFASTLPSGAGETPVPVDQMCSLLGS